MALVLPAPISIIKAVHDKNLLGHWFRRYDTWKQWFVFLKALFALPMNREDRATYERCTGRTKPPDSLTREAYVIVGRRGGKSAMLALVATYLACFIDWRPYLSPGEVGYVQIIAADRKQARTIFRYIRALIQYSPVLRNKLAQPPTASVIELKGQVAIEIMTASFIAVRSYTVIAALCDEMAFWRSDESANPDKEIIAALQPTMATIPFSMLLAASSPYAKRGVIYEARKEYWAKNDADVLIWHTDTRTMNPSFDQGVIDRAYKRDPTAAKTEYDAEFRADIESPITEEMVEANTPFEGVIENQPEPRTSYVAFVDPSGGSVDDMTLAIGHYDRENGSVILDKVIIKHPPFSPDQVTKEFCDEIKRYSQYQVAMVYGDAYGGVWPQERFAKYNVSYILCEKTKSELYSELIPLLTAHRCELLDIPVIKTQLVSLERRVSRNGKVLIDHPPKAHDDVANVVAGVCVMAVIGQIDFDMSDVHLADPLTSATADFLGAELGIGMERELGTRR